MSSSDLGQLLGACWAGWWIAVGVVVLIMRLVRGAF